jgi:hypothetical protein
MRICGRDLPGPKLPTCPPFNCACHGQIFGETGGYVINRKIAALNFRRLSLGEFSEASLRIIIAQRRLTTATNGHDIE